MSRADHTVDIQVASGPYIDPRKGREIDWEKWRLTGFHNPDNRGADGEPVTGYVALSGTGPRGGYYSGPSFYNRERVDAFIAALEQARDHAFPDTQQKGN